MKKMLLACLSVVSLSLVSNASMAISEGERAPFIYVENLYGQGLIDQMTPELMGKVIYLDFWASWCAPCRVSIPWMQELQDQFADQGLKVITISIDEEAQMGRDFVNEYQLSYLMGWDGDNGAMIEAFEPQGMPTSYLIGKDGTVKYLHAGFNESAKADIIAAIEAELAK
jgi:cytochrome c biogenesis protein CcmG, thiol:disulfide interchange protein DsbE